VYTRDDRRGDCRGGDDCLDSLASCIAYTTGDRRRDDRSDSRRDDRPVYTPYNGDNYLANLQVYLYAGLTECNTPRLKVPQRG